MMAVYSKDPEMQQKINTYISITFIYVPSPPFSLERIYMQLKEIDNT